MTSIRVEPAVKDVGRIWRSGVNRPTLEARRHTPTRGKNLGQRE
jgi:hypothetical protein